MAASRRDFFSLGLGVGAGWMAAACEAAATPGPLARAVTDHLPGGPPLPVETPDLPRLPRTWDGGVKVFHLTPEVVKSRFVPWKEINTWGYNGSTPGPAVEVMEGDRVRFVVENRLPEPTTVHWHGLEIPHAMDGAEGISQDLIPPGGKFVYEFTLHQHGTFFYHSHRPMQQMMGMVGLFLIHPRRPYEPRVDRDFAWILQGWAALPGNATPNSLAMEFNWLTMNGKAAPATTPVLCKLGERVRLRFVNLSMDHHPMHLHGHTWVVTGTEGGRVPPAAWTPGNTEIVGVAQARTLELVANNPGDWMIHCHLPHHMMNSMASMVGPLTPPGAAPGYPQDMFMAMDGEVAKPETHGLRPTWTGGMMGMMSLLRVLRPEAYEEIQALKTGGTR
jgi:FtsP/CotA-like multicopper oxidase with cupredoxin domain